MADETKSETGRTLNRLYRNRGETEPTKQLGPNVQFVILETKQGGHRVEADLGLLFPQGLSEPCMGYAAAAFGLNTVLGNEIAGKDKDNPAELAQRMRNRWLAISEDGEWSAGRQGPRIKEVLEAWANDARDRGKTVTEDSMSKMKARLESGDTTREDLLNIPGINAWYQKALAEKAMARFNDAKAAAQSSGAQSSAYDPE